jgi:hypothetical protein
VGSSYKMYGVSVDTLTHRRGFFFFWAFGGFSFHFSFPLPLGFRVLHSYTFIWVLRVILDHLLAVCFLLSFTIQLSFIYIHLFITTEALRPCVKAIYGLLQLVYLLL